MKIKKLRFPRTARVFGKETICSDQAYDISYATMVPGHYEVRFDGNTFLVPFTAVLCATVDPEAVPKHQPVGTPEVRDTPSGTKKKYRTKKAGEWNFTKP